MAVVDGADEGEGAFGEVLLPLVGGGVAEVDAAAGGFDGVGGAAVVEEEGAVAAEAGGGDVGVGGGGEVEAWEVEEGVGGFEAGDVEAVAVLLELPAAAGGGAEGLAGFDLVGDEGEDGVELGADGWVARGGEPGGGEGGAQMAKHKWQMANQERPGR